MMVYRFQKHVLTTHHSCLVRSVLAFSLEVLFGAHSVPQPPGQTAREHSYRRCKESATGPSVGAAA